MGQKGLPPKSPFDVELYSKKLMDTAKAPEEKTVSRRRKISRPITPRKGNDIADEILVRRCVSNNSQDAFDLLFHRHYKGILNYVFRMTGNYDRALELTQEIFIKAYLALHRFNPQYRFTTWIYHIASNRTIDYLRKRHPWHLSLGDRDPGRPSGTPADTLRSLEPSPYEEIRGKEVNLRIHQAIEDLPPSYRDLIVLRHFNHMRYDEIARIRNLPIGTVKNRLFRARECLRRAIF